MPLINCPDCGRQNSDQAIACLQCGRPLRPQPEAFGHHLLRKGCWAILILAILIIGFLILSWVMFTSEVFSGRH
jgi:hypothetical protein